MDMITDNIDIWTSAIKTRSSAGRGSSKKLDLYGIKKLRELILELAVRGKLVPQDPNDEPASVLLERIAAEKAQLVKEKKIKKSQVLPTVNESEVFGRIPSGWCWTRLGEITEIGPRNSGVLDDFKVSFIPMPLISTSYKGDHGSEDRIWSEVKKGYTHFADGDIAIAKITPCFENSKAAVFVGLKNGIGAGTTELHVARPFGDTINRLYILLYLKAPQFLNIGKTKMTGSAGQKRVPKEFFAENPLPLPPLEEQHRIVAKVDELMALCDQLEQQTEASIDAHATLVETLLTTLTNSTGAAELEQNWTRLADHFDTLFTTEQSIDQLKQTVLQLAVMGKLVPQDPNDEPAEVLLKRLVKGRNEWLNANASINAEAKTMLRKLKKLGTPKPPFLLPSS
ncbi:MAG: restriction endonuclease, partial [Neptuniibacter sp. Phe_28]